MVRRLFIRLSLTLAVLGLMTACATLDAPRLSDPSPDEPAGWLVMSVSLNYESGDFPVPFQSNMVGYRSRDTGASAFHRLFTGYFSERRLAEMDLVDGGLHVQVFARRLAPGDYEVYYGYMGTDAGTAQQFVQSNRDFSIPFSVQAGEITYLGNFDARVFEGRNRLGMKIRSGGVFVVGDSMDRDLELAKARLDDSAFNRAPVSRQVPRLEGLVGGIFTSETAR